MEEVFVEPASSGELRGRDESPAARDTFAAHGHSRRAVVREGMKLAFVAPVLTTFFASDARAAGSNHSCYPATHLCDGVHIKEGCCPPLTCQGTVGTKTCQ